MKILSVITAVVSLICGLAFSLATGDFIMLPLTFAIDFIGLVLAYTTALAIEAADNNESEFNYAHS